MPIVTLQLAGETEQRLRELAMQHGQTLEAYLEQLAEQATGVVPALQGLTEQELEHLLEELSEGPSLPHLPADFSRADIYTEHD
jgi:hypothetical protein